MDTAECLNAYVHINKYALQFPASFFGRLVKNEREKTSIRKREEALFREDNNIIIKNEMHLSSLYEEYTDNK